MTVAGRTSDGAAGRNVFAERTRRAGEDFERYLAELQKCMRCGQCRTNCPVFRAYGTETDVARGKLALLAHYLREEERPDRELYGRLTRCVNCGRCRLECPSGTDTGYALLEGRRRLLERVGMPPVKSMAVRGLFGHYGRLRAGARLLALIQPLAFRPRPADPRHVRSIWRLPVLGQKVLLPRMRAAGRRRTVSGAGPGRAGGHAVSTPHRGRAVLYPGCLADLGYPELIDSTVRMAEALGYEVVIPDGLVCCGAPAAYAGDNETARRLAAANIKAILPHLAADPAAKLLFVCPSCATAFGHDYPEYIFGKMTGADSAAADLGIDRGAVELVAGRVQDATAWAWREGAAEHMRAAPGAVQLTVTYHDPCHLRRLLGVIAEPREVLRHLAGAGFRQAPDADACCGFGGTFAMEHAQASASMLEARCRQLQSTGAEVIATACPGCMAWLANGLDRLGADARPVHLIEMMADALTERSTSGGNGGAVGGPR